jgi:hypothetical protein
VDVVNGGRAARAAGGPYGEALTRLQETAPAMPVSTVHRVLTEDLGRDWRRRFAAFDDEPGAAASIGQVHRAVWVDGTPLAHVARRGDARQRDRAAILLIRFLLSSPPRAGRLHGDPHPGNFRLLRAGRDHDPAALFDVATAAGLVPDGRVTPQALLDLLDPLLEPLRHDEFTFSRSWLRGQTTRFSDPRSSVSRTQRRLRAPVHHLLVQRVAAGTTGVLCLLGATVHVANEAAKWLPGLNSQS